MMLQYDQYRGGVPSRSSKAEQSENREGERRTPIRPRESMKDIIYNGVGEENGKGGSRVVAYLFSVIILTSRPIVIIIIKEGEIEIFITSFTISLMLSPRLAVQSMKEHLCFRVGKAPVDKVGLGHRA